MKASGSTKRSLIAMLTINACLLAFTGIANAAGTITLAASEPATIYYTTNGSDPVTSTTSPNLAKPATLPPTKQFNPNIQQLAPSYPTTAPPTSVQHSEYINGVPVITPQDHSKQVRTAPVSGGKVKPQTINPSSKGTDPTKADGQNDNKTIPGGKLKPYVSPKKKQPPKTLTINQEQQP